ncbi:MAG TPA: hypothetical protein VFB99_09390 [Vicinamibacterales bacterium]|nr:hypothetical protein [Vicinamibacterales bacterium]
MPVWIGDEAYRILQREPAGIIRDLKGACMKPAIAEDAAVHGVTECRELFMAGVELSPVIEGPFGVIAADARFRDEPAPRDGA